MTIKSRQKCKYLENEKSFEDEISIFHHFKEFSVAKNHLRPENPPLKLSFSWKRSFIEGSKTFFGSLDSDFKVIEKITQKIYKQKSK